MNKRKIYDEQLIIITGAAGLIGSNVVRYLNAKGQTNIILVDDLGTGLKWKNLVGTKYADFLPIYALDDWLQGREDDIEAIIHLGANSSTLETNADELIDSNYRASINLAEYSFENDLRFIYASSAATYGLGENGFSDDHELLDNLMPINMYGYSKHMFDQWLYRQGAIEDAVGLKYFNIYGPGEIHKGRMASMGQHMTKQILEKGSVRLYKSNDQRFADGDQVRDFLYVKDAAAMTCAFLDSEVGGIFNIGSGIESTWNQFAKALFAALDRPENIEYIPMPEDLSKQYQNYTLADMSKFKGVFPKFGNPTTLEDACKDYVAYLLPFIEERGLASI